MVSGPALRRARPENVPELQFTGLPEYVTTSEEEGEPGPNAGGEGDTPHDDLSLTH